MSITTISDLSQFPTVALEEIYCGKGVKGSPRLAIADRLAVVDQASRSVYAVVTPDYQLVRHEELVTSVEKELACHPEYGQPVRTIRYQPAVGRMKLEYKFPTIHHEIRPGDVVNPTWTFFNSYDGSWALKGFFGAFRLICSNGAVIGTKFAGYRKEHHQFGEQLGVDQLRHLMSTAMEKYSGQLTQWREWVDDHLSAQQAEAVLSGLSLSKGQFSRLLKEQEVETGETLTTLFGSPEVVKGDEVVSPYVPPTRETITRWMLFCIVTQFITHSIHSLTKQKRLEARARVVFG